MTTDNEIMAVDIEKYANALNNLIGVDSAYFNGDKDVDAIVEIITLAKKMETTISHQRAEIESLETDNNYMSEQVKDLKNAFTVETDIIFEQKSEIEKLKTEIRNQSILWSRYFVTTKEALEAEAIKRCIENAKEELYEWVGADNSIPYPRIKKVLDNLAKKMVGEK